MASKKHKLTKRMKMQLRSMPSWRRKRVLRKLKQKGYDISMGNVELIGQRRGYGPVGLCLCPNCRIKIKHERGKPCFNLSCPQCGSKMVRVLPKPYIIGAAKASYALTQARKLTKGKAFKYVWGPKKGKTEKANAKRKKTLQPLFNTIRVKTGQTQKNAANKLAAILEKQYQMPRSLVQELIGKRFKLAKKQAENRSIKAVIKKVANVAKKGLTAVVKVVGPAIATVFPAAAPLINQGLKLVGDAQKGIQGAIDKVNDIKKLAGMGDEKGKKMLDVLTASREIQKQVRGETPPAPGALIIDKARLQVEAKKQGLVILQP